MKTLFINRDGGVRAGWKIAACLLLTGLLAATLIAVRRLLPVDLQRVLLEPVLMAVGALLAAWICLRIERAPLTSIGLRLDTRFLRDGGRGTLAGIGLLALSALLVWLGDGFHLERALAPEGRTLVVWKIVRTLLPLAVFEELTFRGYPFQRALASLGPRSAVLVFALLFALIHLPNPGLNGGTFVLAVANLFLASVMLSLCYLRTRSLALPIGVHLGWNLAQTCLGFPSSGNPSHGVWMPIFHGKAAWLTGGEFGLEASFAGVVVLALAIVVLAQWTPSASARPRAVEA
jgi:membrane protease YdiL (CAAX protease family)